MDKLNQPHDRYFRSTFGEVSFVKDFLNNYLPEELLAITDMSTLEPQPTTFIDEKLKEQFADLLFRVNIMDKEAYVYFLFEHKSYRDRMVIFQVLKYMMEVWEAKIEDDIAKRKELDLPETADMEIPIIIPLVVYHNKDNWNVKRTLGEMIPNFDSLPDNVKKYIPDFEYMLSDLSNPEDEEVNLEEEYSIIIRILNRTRYATKDEIIEVFTRSIMLFTKTKDKDMVRRYVTESTTYILGIRDDITEKELIEVAEKISEEGGELVMTAAERLREEGEVRGEIKSMRKSIKVALFNRFNTANSEMNDLIDKIDDLILLENLFNKTFQVQSSDEFKVILYNITK